MKVVIDDKIPFVKGVLEPFAEVEYVSGAEISSEKVKDADALIIRTRTKCNAALLDGSAVKFIATATIGYDHIDEAYCKKSGIEWTNAPGCNSGSVLQYIASVLAVLKLKAGVDVDNSVLGIVGVGNVGSKVERLCRILGIKVLLCDPPRQEKEGGDFVSFEDVMERADIITFHVPLDSGSKYPTYHMLDEKQVRKLKRKPVIINSSRGEVIDNEAIKMAIKEELVSQLVLDVWENEPDIDSELLNDVLIGTPHIAGYSADGKANGTSMSVNALSRFFKLPLNEWSPDDVPGVENNQIIMGNKNAFELFLKTYEIEIDSDKLKYEPEKFEWFRGHYPLRREFAHYNVELKSPSAEFSEKLARLGFRLK